MKAKILQHRAIPRRGEGAVVELARREKNGLVSFTDAKAAGISDEQVRVLQKKGLADKMPTGISLTERGKQLARRHYATPRLVVHVGMEYRGLHPGSAGVGDVIKTLTEGTASRGIETHVFLPWHENLQRLADTLVVECQFDLPMKWTDVDRSVPVKVWGFSSKPNLHLHFIDAPIFRSITELDTATPRNGLYGYNDKDCARLNRPDLLGQPFHCTVEMQATLKKGTITAIAKLGLKPDIIHAHDGHCADIGLLLQESNEFCSTLGDTSVAVSAHNINVGYQQEVADIRFVSRILGVPIQAIEQCLLNGKYNPFVAGAFSGSTLTTVSPGYATSLNRAGDWKTGGLVHRLLGMGVKIEGIYNAIDPTAYDPETSTLLAANFSTRAGELAGKEVCKLAFLEDVRNGRFAGVRVYGSLDHNAAALPLDFSISRMAREKGVVQLAEALDKSFSGADPGFRFVLLAGGGDQSLRQMFIDLAALYLGKFVFLEGHSSDVATKLYAAGDFFVNPATSEPCGLTDGFGIYMGCIPCVNSREGLRKITDSYDGISYVGGVPELCAALNRTVGLYSNKSDLLRMLSNGIAGLCASLAPERVVEKYVQMYAKVIHEWQIN